MANKYWFKPKRYGWGFVPVTWEGWLTTLVLIGIIFLLTYLNGLFEDPPREENFIWLVIEIILVGIVSIVFFKEKMKEELKWRWGKRQ